MNIKYLLNKDIDLDKYNACIACSINERIYALSWYLDLVTDNWDALILNDYEAVMPLPRRKKYGLDYIYQAPWVQQLGVFSKNEITPELLNNFIAHLPKKFVLVDYLFNSENLFANKKMEQRTNYILRLNRSFESLTDSFNKNKKRIVKKDFSAWKILKNGNKSDFLELYKIENIKFPSHKDAYDKLNNLLKSDSINVWNVYEKEKIIAGLLWLKDDKRITYLVPVATDDAKKEDIPTFLVTELMKEFENTDYIFDFEGSMVKGVAKFYQSFGAEKEFYYWYKKRLI